ncbi:MAG: hypothetical protein LBD16_03425 [Oscillospiraceae bacterium]|jgi:hypothetical protein|nr:hypothetical protein [Oscillospiraceae bacterium]
MKRKYKALLGMFILLLAVTVLAPLMCKPANADGEENNALWDEYHTLREEFSKWQTYSITGYHQYEPTDISLAGVSLYSVEGLALFADKYAPCFKEFYLTHPEKEHFWPVPYNVLISAIPYSLPSESDDIISIEEAVAIAKEALRTQYDWSDELFQTFREPAISYRIYEGNNHVWHVGYYFGINPYEWSREEYAAVLDMQKQKIIPYGGSVYINALNGSIEAVFELTQSVGHTSGELDDTVPRFDWNPGMPVPTPSPTPQPGPHG